MRVFSETNLSRPTHIDILVDNRVYDRILQKVKPKKHFKSIKSKCKLKGFYS